MPMQTILTDDPCVPACAVAERINRQLASGQPVLWLLSGGSAIGTAVAASHLIKPNPLLCVSLADERYGQPGHSESNFRQLLAAGFDLPIVPILNGGVVEREARNFARFLLDHQSDYRIGIFGMGTDGHTAGILPNSMATADTDDLVFFYSGAKFERITTTPHFLAGLDSAHLWAQGLDKSPQLAQLQKDDEPIKQPVQFLKMAQEFIIYTTLNP